MRHQLVATHDIVATALELASVKPDPAQARDSVSLMPVLLGQRGDDQPVRSTLIVQGMPGRDALTEPLPKPGQSMSDAYAAVRDSDVRGGEDARATPHAFREGTWKLTFNIAGKPVGLHDLASDLAEAKNLIADPAHSGRALQMEKLYRELLKAERSVASGDKAGK